MNTLIKGRFQGKILHWGYFTVPIKRYRHTTRLPLNIPYFIHPNFSRQRSAHLLELRVAGPLRDCSFRLRGSNIGVGPSRG